MAVSRAGVEYLFRKPGRLVRTVLAPEWVRSFVWVGADLFWRDFAADGLLDETDEVPELGDRYRIRSIPTMAVMQRGQELARVAGAMPAEQIEQFVRASLSKR